MSEIINSPYRFIFGISFFVIFGLIDYIRNPSNPKRAKEYLFFASVSLLTVLFAIFHDFFTFNISQEYFEIGKGLGKGVIFFPNVLILAFKGSYWVGLVIGALFLIINNPSKIWPQLSYQNLYKLLLWPLLFSIGSAVIAYMLSFYFYPTFTKGAEKLLIAPKDFEHVLFIHYGTYIGALIGTLLSLYKIRTLRKESLY